MAAGTVLSAFVSARLVARLGRRGTLLLAGAVLVAGLAVLLLGTVTALTLTGAGVASIGGSLAISAAQPALAVHHGPRSASAVSEANGAGALFGLVAPLTVGATVAAGWGWRPAVAVTALLAVLACVLVTPPARPRRARPPGAGPGRRAAAAAPAPDRSAGGSTARSRGRSWHPRASWCFTAALIAAVAVENATTFWVADLVGDRTGAGPGIATAALAGLVGAMALTRFGLGALLRRRSAETLLVAAFGVAAVGWLVVWTATSTPVALAGLLLAGLGYGAHYPLAIALVLRAAGRAAGPGPGRLDARRGAGHRRRAVRARGAGRRARDAHRLRARAGPPGRGCRGRRRWAGAPTGLPPRRREGATRRSARDPVAVR